MDNKEYEISNLFNKLIENEYHYYLNCEYYREDSMSMPLAVDVKTVHLIVYDKYEEKVYENKEYLKKGICFKFILLLMLKDLLKKLNFS